MKGNSVRLGKRYRDTVTTFEGIAVAATEYLQGCRRITLEKLDEKGERIISLTFDEPNLETVRGAGGVATATGVRTGGPHDHDSLVDRHE